MTPSFVIDASVAMTWLFKDEITPATQRLLKELSNKSGLVPAWWYVEIANVLALAERKGRVNTAEIVDFIAVLASAQIEADNEAPQRAFTHLLPLCRNHGLTSYDAMYLDLAQRRKLPLATLDEPLRKAAKKLGVKLLGK
jgi:predicted nucleic acid-binding protein